TLIQTGKVRHFPVVLIGTDYWGGMLDWIRGTMLSEGKISSPDFELLCLTDDPTKAVEHVTLRYREQLDRRRRRRQEREAHRKRSPAGGPEPPATPR
ncbi:MAG: LOG family protein, partial [Gemmatimonadota bacterium]